MTFRNLRLAMAPVAVLSGGLLMVSNASASVINTLLSGSTGNVTVSLNSLIFNNDPSALPLGTCTTTLGRGCNADVASGTTLTFTGGPLATGEGMYINNNDLTTTPPGAADANTFLTFASHPNLVFSETVIGPGSSNTNCAALAVFGSCSVFLGSPIVLVLEPNNQTEAILSVSGRASDTGVAGLAAGSAYSGLLNAPVTNNLPNGALPTPGNIQAYFCPNGAAMNTCTPADFALNRSLTNPQSQSGSFTATAIPEPSAVFLGSLGLVMLLVGARFRKSHGTRV